MSTAPTGRDAAAPELTQAEQAMAQAATAWVGQLARTLKTCRLYDANNPTVIKFREELRAALGRLLEDHGKLVLRFTSDDVFWNQVSLYPARSRDDNLALPLYRDGIQTLTLLPGIETEEVETLLDLMLRASARASHGDEDLVSLIWDAELMHVEITYVAADADVDDGTEGGPEQAQQQVDLPWPGNTPAAFGPRETVEPATPGGSLDTVSSTRAEDWESLDFAQQAESILNDLEGHASVELDRFRKEHEAEVGVSNLGAALALVSECLCANPTAEDRVELSRFIARLLREAVALGGWSDARLALDQLRKCQSPEWSLDAFLGELADPNSVLTVSTVARLDAQGVSGVQEFLELGRELGPPAVEWLMRVLAESQQQRTRRPLTKTIAELCRENPERLAPYLSDERWYVVRNVVHILGWIGGNPIAGLLRATLRHPERRVVIEVVAALAQVEPAVSKPILLEMLVGAESRVFTAVLHQLAAGRDPEVAALLMKQLQSPEFSKRPPEEMRAIYSALASTGGDEILPELEAELTKPKGWFSSGNAPHIQALARCIARIGTPAALAVLERGSNSRSAPTRDACRDAMNASRSHE